MIKNALLIGAYLFAIVAANLFITAFGKTGLLITSVALIPFDLFSRDLLHHRWHGKNLVLRMFCLILAGGVLSFIINSAAMRISVASCMAFSVAATVDTIVYQLLFSQTQFWKMTISNVFSSITDSLIFITIVFGFSFHDVGLQSGSKFAGALVWTFVYIAIRKKK